jgi:hypothetical protein
MCHHRGTVNRLQWNRFQRSSKINSNRILKNIFMYLDSTTDKLEVVLTAAITTNQLPFIAAFNDTTSTSVTPTKNTGTTNSTTAVSLVSAPAASHQRLVRYISLYNADTATAEVTVRFNDNASIRKILVVSLLPNESLQYTYEVGWKAYDSTGAEKVTGFYMIAGALRSLEFYSAANITTAQTLVNTGTAYCLYLGRAERSYSSMQFQYKTTTALTATISWAELAVYKGTPSIGTATTITRLGYTDCSSIWNGALANKTTSVTLTGCNAGDDLWVVFSNSTSGTGTGLRAGLADDIGSGVFMTKTNTRPSTSATISGATVDNTTPMLYVLFNGIY